MTSVPDREATYSPLRGSLSAAGISRRRPGSSQGYGAVLLPNTRPFPVPGKMTGKIPIGRKVSRRYSPDRCTTASCSVIWRNVALAVMWLCRTARRSGTPCTGSGISPSVSGMSAVGTRCATAFLRPVSLRKTFR